MLLENYGLPKRELNILHKKGIQTTEDYLRIFPRTYRDYRQVKFLRDCVVNDYAAVSGTVVYASVRRGRKQYIVLKLREDNGIMFTAMLFQNTYNAGKYLALQEKVAVVAGKVLFTDEYGYSISNPDILIEKEHFKPILFPVYPKYKGISEEKFMSDLQHMLMMVSENVEDPVWRREGMMSNKDALWAIHCPANMEDISRGMERVIFNDILYFLLETQAGRPDAPSETKRIFKTSDKTEEFIRSLPYKLTNDQNNIIHGIISNASAGIRNNMLINGDVGVGKTIIAAAVMICAVENGYQAVLMAPKSELARQHFEEIKGYADSLGLTCAFLHSGMKAKEKREVLGSIKDGSANIIIGTHSCISKDVEYKNVGLIVTDEEHLFGVEQKKALEEKAGEGIHTISMSATPIPRTIATTIYGNDKELVYIKDKPGGRLPIKTASCRKHKTAMEFMYSEVNNGHQCYVVCPAIDDNDEYEIASIEKISGIYGEYFAPRGVSVAVVNGRMKKEDMNEALDKFREGKVSVLISTTVIEVGINVPNATVMVVEQADRFGLATLHQLRGRVGRSNLQSYCILVTDHPEKERIKVMCKTTDGFEIAAADYKQRGPGDVLGVKQSGKNIYIEEMIENPEIYKKAKDAMGFCAENKFGQWLKEEYRASGREAVISDERG